MMISSKLVKVIWFKHVDNQLIVARFVLPKKEVVDFKRVDRSVHKTENRDSHSRGLLER